MDLLEHEGKKLFREAGLPVPAAVLARTPAEARRAAERLGPRVCVKAQTRSGGRGKAGGIRVCGTAAEAEAAAADIMALVIQGQPVEALLVERAVDIARELYLAVAVSREARGPLLVFARDGGVDIEELARSAPEAIVRRPIDPLLGLLEYQVRDVVEAAQFGPADPGGTGVGEALAAVCRALWRLYRERDCTLAEVNPLALTTTGEVVCLDSKITLDENAFFQQVKSYAALGVAPDGADGRDLTFPDQCARAFVHLFDLASTRAETFHLFNPHGIRLSRFLTAPGLGLNLATSPVPSFMEMLADRYEVDAFHGAIEALMLHMGWYDRDPSVVPTPHVWMCEKTVRILEATGFRWPEPEPAAMRRMVLAALAERRRFLAHVPAFSLLDEDEVDALAIASRAEWLGPDAFAAREGEDTGQVYALVSGALEVSKTSRDGWVGTVRVLGPGEVVGKDALLHELPSPVSVQSIFGGAHVLAFDAASLRTTLRESPRLALGFAKHLSHAINKLDSLFVSMG